MKKVVIVDDEPLAKSIVIEYLEQQQNYTIVAECDDGFEGVKAILKHKPDLVFLDIQMPKINGFEMLELLDYSPSVIFTTAFDQYAIRAFEANAVDYLLKPFSKERFDAALKKWELSNVDNANAKEHLEDLIETPEKQADEKNRIVVRFNNEIQIVPVNEVFYIEAYDDYVKIFTRDNYFLKKKTLRYYEQVLDESIFFRSHRSYMINLAQLTKIEPLEKNNYVGLLKNGKKIPISRAGYIKIKEKLGI